MGGAPTSATLSSAPFSSATPRNQSALASATEQPQFLGAGSYASMNRYAALEPSLRSFMIRL